MDRPRRSVPSFGMINLVRHSKVVRGSCLAVVIITVAYASLVGWNIIRQKMAEAKERSVQRFVTLFQPQLETNRRFENVRVVGYRCDAGSHPCIVMRGTVLSQEDWDSLNRLCRLAEPPFPLSVQAVSIRPPPSTFVGYGGTVDPSGHVEFGRGLGRPTVEMAMSYLSSANLFAPGGWGYYSISPNEVLAVLFIAMQTNAVELFSNIVTHGRPEAKLYALCGIRKVSPGEFDVLASSAATSAGWSGLSMMKEIHAVRTARGCVSRLDSPSRIIEAIRGGEYDGYFGIKRAN